MPPRAKFSKEIITEAAFDIVKKNGMEALTARSLSGKLKCSVCPIFTVFKDMEEVQKEVVSASKKLYSEYVKQGLSMTPAFKGAGTSYIKFAKDEPKLFQILFMSEQRYGEENSGFPQIDDNYDIILASVRDGYSLSSADAEKIYTHLSIYSHGIATLIARKVCNFTESEVSNMLTEVFIALLKEVRRNEKHD